MLRKFSALIRANFGIDPTKLSAEEFVERSTEAIWVENFREERTRQSQEAMIIAIANAMRG